MWSVMSSLICVRLAAKKCSGHAARLVKHTLASAPIMARAIILALLWKTYLVNKHAV
jgi:hypothetical protein